ncbi:MAG TPA: DinB family protein [Longimicrobiaceae bacterium]|nr:DinB family protein [Longimicrobiaceae bacterium]
MYRTIADFENAWKIETDNTLKVLRALTDESLAQTIAPEFGSLGSLAWHLVWAAVGLSGAAGLPVEGPGRSDPQPSSAAEIATAYEKVAKAVRAAATSRWTDANLADKIPFFGREIPAGMLLSIIVLHQTHHRGQMTVLMRQAGLAVPGMYGPSREEMEAMIAAGSR